MSFFRSEPISLCHMVLHKESAFNCLVMLGYEEKVQFRNIYDGHPIINNQFTEEVHRCQELKRLISYLQQETDKSNIETVIYPDVDEDEIPEVNDLKFMESTVQQIYEDLVQTTNTFEILKKKRFQLSEMWHVLQKADMFFGTQTQSTQPIMAWTDSVIKLLMKNELQAELNEGIHLSFFTGTIPLERLKSFETMLWRITKGYFYMKYEELILTTQEYKQSFAKNFPRKYIFMVFFLGQELRKKIAKMCQGFGIKLYECSEAHKERQLETKSLKSEIQDLDIVLEHTEQQHYNLLLITSADIYIWRVKINKLLKVYYVLNRMGRVRHLHMRKYLTADCWIPSRDVSTIRAALLFGAKRTAKGNKGSVFLPMLTEIHRRHLKNIDKPTYFVLNKFTKGFQNLIDSYGMAEYQELNPAPYTIITFPFLFAVMFGDVGHGVIMLLFGLWLIWRENLLLEKQRFSRKQSEIFNILFAGRYIIALMGAFSIYTGFIYNDCFSKGFNIFGSSWRSDFNQTTVNSSYQLQLDPSNREHYLGRPYIFGMDPVWKVSGENAITTFNSLKMKLAIILGITQMIFGLILAAINFIHKKEYVNLLLVFCPQFTFLVSIFVYLVFLIFYKWLQFGGQIETPYNSACAPSILLTFINMLMMKGPEEPPAGCETWMFELQPYLQAVLLTVALISIPVLLAGKPLYLMIEQQRIQRIKNETIKNTRRRTNRKSIHRSLMYNVESSFYDVKIVSSKRETETVLSELWIHSGKTIKRTWAILEMHHCRASDAQLCCVCTAAANQLMQMLDCCLF